MLCLFAGSAPTPKNILFFSQFLDFRVWLRPVMSQVRRVFMHFGPSPVKTLGQNQYHPQLRRWSFAWHSCDIGSNQKPKRKVHKSCQRGCKVTRIDEKQDSAASRATFC